MFNLTTDAAILPDPYLKTHLGQFDRRFLSHHIARLAFAILVLTILIVPTVQFVITIQKIDTSPFRESGQRHRTALGRWLPTAELLLKQHADGAAPSAEDESAALTRTDNPYGYGHWFPTPPLVLICLAPLAKLGVVGAGVVWSILKLGGLSLAAWLLLREMKHQGHPIPIGVLLMTLVFGIRPIISDIQHGNLNIFMLIWLALAWTCYLRGKDAWAGLLLALAIVTKITPALALVYFLYKRHWRLCAWAGIGLVLVFILIPGVVLGFEYNLMLLRTWFDMLVRPFAVEGYAATEIANQSLYGVLLRLLSNSGILRIESMPADEMFKAGMEHMDRPATQLGRLLRPAISLLMLAILAWSCRRRGTARSDPHRLLEFGMVLVAMLLLSERTWKHHATTLPLVYLGIWYALTCLPTSDRFRAACVAGLVVQLLLLVIVGEGVVGDRMADRLLEGGYFCWGLLICLIQIAVMLRHLERSASVALTAPEPASLRGRSPNR